MSKTTHLELGVGLFIAMGFACALALAFASTDARGRVPGETYAIKARFSNLGELKVQAPVKIAGVKVGEVTSIALDPDRYDAIVTLRVSRGAGELPADSSAAIYTSGLLGERYVGISPGGDPQALEEGGEIVLTQPAVVLEQLIGKYMFGGSTSKPGQAAAEPSGETPVETPIRQDEETP
jgi:phospholipid/cholesterol/gamma-HCH transport system substrate-binding protein